MSLRALTWAFDLELRPGTKKFVLVAMADFAGETGICYPSTETICRKTCLDRKTVVSALDELVSEKFLTDTGKRTGKTGQVKVYRMDFNYESKAPENGTVKGSRFSHSKAPVFPIKDSRKRDTLNHSEDSNSEEVKCQNEGGEPSGTSNRNQEVPENGLSPLGVRIGEWFKRREDTRWGDNELRKLKQIEKWKFPIEDIDLLERYYSSGAKFLRQDVLTLLNNWNGELDRARSWEKNPNDRTAQEKAHSVSPFQRKKAVEEAIASHACNKESLGHNPNASPSQWEEYKLLKATLKEINTQLITGNT